MGLLTTQLLSKLRKATGLQDQDDMSDADGILILNQSYWELMDKYPFKEKEVRVTFPTVAGVRNYNCPTPFEALRHLAILNPQGEAHTPLDQISEDVYEQEYDASSDNQAIPTKYVREGCQILLFPTPDDAYTITMRYWTTLDNLTSVTGPNMPQSWHEIILFGAIWRAFIEICGDYVRGMGAKNFQQSLINNAVPVQAKEEENNPRAGLEVIVPSYP